MKQWNPSPEARRRRAVTIGSFTLLILLLVLIPVSCHHAKVTPEKTGKVLPKRSAEETAAEQVLSRMTLDQKIYQLMFVTPESLTGITPTTAAAGGTQAALQKYPVGGIIYFSPNLKTQDQTKQMILNSQNYATQSVGVPLFIGVDEEGGTVARCAYKLGTTKFRNMQTYREQGTEVAYTNAKTIATDLLSLGFNVDFAPVADVNTPGNTVIGTRAYSTDYKEAAQLVASAVKGFHDGGVGCSVKHFPGHGSTKQDSHVTTATIDKTLQELKSTDFLPFQSGVKAGADMVMVGHIVDENLSPEPASLSKEVISILRKQLKFDGIVITDSLAMGAIANRYSPKESARRAILAGNDMILCPVRIEESHDGILEAVQSGELSEQQINDSVKRILLAKIRLGILDVPKTDTVS